MDAVKGEGKTIWNKVNTIYSDFFTFFSKGNVLDLAVAVIIGGAFQAIVNSLVNDIIMPPIGLIVGKNFNNWFFVIREGNPPGPYTTLATAGLAGAVTINIGNFLQALINFVLIAWLLFIIIRVVIKLRETEAPPPPPPTEEPCPFCTMNVSKKATRCPHCTSQIQR